MIQLTEDLRKDKRIALGAIWVGNSGDERRTNMKELGIGAILNVAQDLVHEHNWMDELEVMHIGIIDGPGNEPVLYCAAVLGLRALLRRHNVLVCCHDGGRSVAVIIMYFAACHISGWPGDWQAGWNEWLGNLQKRATQQLPIPHLAHKAAFDKMKRSILTNLIKD